MTCIVGIIDKDRVHIAGDSMSSNGSNSLFRKDPNVFSVGDYIFGCASSYRMGQLLRYKLTIPKFDARKPIDVPSKEDETPTMEDRHFAYMCVSFIEAVRNTFREGGCLQEESSMSSGGIFLVGYKNFLYQIDSDFQVIKPLDNYIAIGSGRDIALGSLNTSSIWFQTNSYTRMQLAISAASYHDPFVGGCIQYLST